MSDLRADPAALDFLKDNGFTRLFASSFTPLGNIGAGEDNLMTAVVPKFTLDETKSIVKIRAFGRTAANANTKQLKIKLGATTLMDSGAVALNNQRWDAEVIIARTGVGTQEIYATFQSGSTLVQTRTAGTLDETADLTLLFTGEATATDDIIQSGMIAEAQGAV